MTIDSSRQDLEAEEKRANDPEPRASEYHRGCLIVHWRGYVKDHEPTAKARAEGRTVIVYDDNQDEVFLRPTAYPHVPEPWASRCIKYASGRAPMCGGRDGRRFITNGHWQCVVDDATFAGALAQGWRDVGDRWNEPATLPCPPVPLSALRCARQRLGSTVESEVDILQIGGVWVQALYVDLLREIGATDAAGVETVEDIGVSSRVVVPGVAVVMGIRDVRPEEIVASEAT
jgi:hypothetical protein